MSTARRLTAINRDAPAFRAFHASEERLFDHYRLAVTERFLDLSDPPMVARVLDSGSGDPVLFVHGAGSSAAVWLPLIAQLPGIRALAVDRPGSGLSDGFDYRGVDVRSHAVSFLDSVVMALGLNRIPVVAHSMGGLWSLWFAVDRPQRVSRLGLLGCPALLLDTSAPLIVRLGGQSLIGPALIALRSRRSPAQIGRSTLRMNAGAEAAARLPDELVTVYGENQELPHFALAFSTLIGRLIGLRGVRPGASFGEDELRRIRQPVLFLWGESDPFGSPDVGRRACKIISDTQIEVLPDRHMPWLADPGRCASLLEAFLPQQHVPPAAGRE